MEKYRIVFWGTYDLNKPRVRLLLKGARAVGIEVIECHTDIWDKIEDKSQISTYTKLRLLAYALFYAYPSLIWRYLRMPPHDAVLIGYMGQLDVLVIWPFARLRRVPVIWDVFISLYDTVVNDRKLISKSSPLAKILYILEWLACRMADKIFLDTNTHARYFEKTFKLPHESVGRVFVGVESDIFSPCLQTQNISTNRNRFTVLFYGQFIPLHGIDVIVKAAKIFEQLDKDVRFIIIGQGQERDRIEALINELDVKSIKRISWVPYEQLVNWICQADVCLGIFGTTGKALRVIPNKVYQILATKRPLITADTPAIRELLEEGDCVYLVPPGNPEELASALRNIKNEKYKKKCKKQNAMIIGPTEVGNQLKSIIIEAISQR